MKILRDISLFVWQLPQNLLALLLVAVLKAKYGIRGSFEHEGIQYLHIKDWKAGVSLGRYVLLGDIYADDALSIAHETGHCRQSLYLGPLYLIIIGIPSAIGNRWDWWFHRGWSKERSSKWYYNLPWEKWADKLGGVNRWQ